MDIQDILALGGRQRVFRARRKVQEPGFISHITQRAAGKDPLFLEERDYLAMLRLLKKSSELFGLNYYSFCLMPNHVHILVEPGKKNLAQAMKYVFGVFAAEFNRKYERKGHLFGGPYRQAICLDDSYLLAASIYIHLNPVRAGLNADPLDYRWTSARLFTYSDQVHSFVDPTPVLKLLDEDDDAARLEYSRLLQGGTFDEPLNPLEQEGIIEGFCSKLAEKFPAVFNRLRKNSKAAADTSTQLIELNHLEQMIHDFDAGLRRDPESKKARKFLVEQLLARGYNKTAIARRLGISRGTVHNILNT